MQYLPWAIKPTLVMRESMHYSHMGMKKSNYKKILNMKYLCKTIKPLFMVIYLMKLDALYISNN